MITKKCGKFEREDYQAEIKELLEKARSDFEKAKQDVVYWNCMQEDLLHEAESNPMDGRASAKWAKKLKEVRIKRRDANVTYHYLLGFVNLINNPTFQGKINVMLDKKLLNYNDQPYKPRIQDEKEEQDARN